MMKKTAAGKGHQPAGGGADVTTSLSSSPHLRHQHPHRPARGGGKQRPFLSLRVSHLAITLVVVGTIWFIVVWKQHSIVVTDHSRQFQQQQQQQQQKHAIPSIKRQPSSPNLPNLNQNNNDHQGVNDPNNNNVHKDSPPTTQRHDNRRVDAVLNTIPLHLVSNTDQRKTSQSQRLRSFLRCIHHGRYPQYGYSSSDKDDDDTSWKFRSCEFTNLCFDINTYEYVFVVNDDDQNDNDKHGPRAYDNHMIYTMNAMAIGGINPRWNMKKGFDMGDSKVKWFPTIRKSTQIHSYYTMPESYIWIPIHSFGGHNVGHLLWDDFYPIYRLLQLFGYVHDEEDAAGTVDGGEEAQPHQQQRRPYKYFIMRHVLNETLYASCDIRRNKRIQCTNNYVKFLELLHVDPLTFTSNKRIQFQVLNGNNNINNPPSSLVCSKIGLAGIGMLTDHGLHDHGWEYQQSWVPHNYMHGDTFYSFRNFILNNIQSKYHLQMNRNALVRTSSNEMLAPVPLPQYNTLRITFSVLSSRDFDRRLDFGKQIHALQKAADATEHRETDDIFKDVSINSYALWNMTVPEQVQVALDTNIWISACGGASMTSTFLSRHASLILFYNETGGLNFSTMTNNGKPARLDWDLLHNSHTRVHWFPIGTMNTPQQIELFIALIRHELSYIRNLLLT